MRITNRELLNYFSRHRLRFIAGWRHTIDRAYTGFHSHNSAELVYHMRGGGQTRERGGSPAEYGEGSVVMHPAGIPHDQRLTPPSEDACIHFVYPGRPRGLLKRRLITSPIQDMTLREELLRLTQVPLQVATAGRLALDLRLTALVFQILQGENAERMEGSLSPVESLVEKACAHMRRHFDRIRGVEEVARHVGVSHHYLRHVFKPSRGVSLVGWLNRLRIDRAKELLAHSMLPLKLIATMSGFQNERYFCTRFRRQMGISPGAYRRSNR